MVFKSILPMRFESYNLLPSIKSNIQKMGFKRPTDIQYKSIPPILKGEDVLAVAQTGTGKTAAYAIPLVQLLCTRSGERSAFSPRCLVLVPTHELAQQVSDVFYNLMSGTSLYVLGLYGGIDQAPQIDRLSKGVDVLVATPGRMFDLASQKHLNFHNVEVLVVDEADHMLELGFIHDLEQLVRRIPRKRQTLFYSATINERVKDLAYGLVRHAVRIHLSAHDPVSKNIDHSVVYVEMDHKRFFLEHLVREYPESKILVFVRTRIRADRVAKALERVGIPSQTIHGSKEQEQRTQAMEAFRSGTCMVLIATDVSARGIDIPKVEVVVNYDLPVLAENYVHRVGRTGRGTNRGIAISFCSPGEVQVLSEIETYLGKPVNTLSISRTEYEATIDFSQDASHDWKSLIDEQNAWEAKAKRRKSRE